MQAGSELLDALPVAIYTTDAAGRITYYNQAAADFWGVRPTIGEDLWCGSWRLFWPDGTPLPHDECPMATTLRSGQEVRGASAVAERPDGTRVHFRPYPTLLRDPATGAIIGAINLLVDEGAALKAEATSARLAAIVESSDDVIISKKLDGTITSWNDSATRILGYTAEEMIGQSILRIIPPELQDEEKQIIARISLGERIQHFDTVRISKSGERIDLSLTVSPLRDGSGKITGASKVARDVSDRKRNDELQRLLFNELNHRVKNTLATIQAIAGQSLRRASSPAQFVASFNGRVQSLAKAHDLLVEQQMAGADFLSILREQVLLGGQDTAKIQLHGPSVSVDARTAVQLGLVLHELATNARKYGALAGAEGSLVIRWRVTAGQSPVLHVEWVESGLKGITVPSEQGFGTVLIERSLRANGGFANISYREDGVTCDISLPIGELSQPVAQRSGPRDAGLDPIKRLSDISIIVVEDEPLVAMEIEDTLTELGGLVVGTATNISEADALIDRGGFDIALLDCNLLGLPVTGLARKLRENGIPIVFATGYGASGVPAGFEGTPVLAKPFQVRELVAAIAEASGSPAGNVVQLVPRD